MGHRCIKRVIYSLFKKHIHRRALRIAGIRTIKTNIMIEISLLEERINLYECIIEIFKAEEKAIKETICICKDKIEKLKTSLNNFN